MQVHQTTLLMKPFKRGFHIITNEINNLLESYHVSVGTIHIFLQHTSASLTINENVDPSVREDMENFFNDTVDDKSYYIHTYEGADDMPAHIKSSLLGQSLTIPITDGKLNLGTWQGIYLGEHRDNAASRKLIITIYAEQGSIKLENKNRVGHYNYKQTIKWLRFSPKDGLQLEILVPDILEKAIAILYESIIINKSVIKNNNFNT